jgi:hypothetical protein
MKRSLRLEHPGQPTTLPPPTTSPTSPLLDPPTAPPTSPLLDLPSEEDVRVEEYCCGGLRVKEEYCRGGLRVEEEYCCGGMRVEEEYCCGGVKVEGYDSESLGGNSGKSP